jgi:hypothetical protein
MCSAPEAKPGDMANFFYSLLGNDLQCARPTDVRFFSSKTCNIALIVEGRDIPSAGPRLLPGGRLSETQGPSAAVWTRRRASSRPCPLPLRCFWKCAARRCCCCGGGW